MENNIIIYNNIFENIKKIYLKLIFNTIDYLLNIYISFNTKKKVLYRYIYYNITLNNKNEIQQIFLNNLKNDYNELKHFKYNKKIFYYYRNDVYYYYEIFKYIFLQDNNIMLYNHNIIYDNIELTNLNSNIYDNIYNNYININQICNNLLDKLLSKYNIEYLNKINIDININFQLNNNIYNNNNNIIIDDNDNNNNNIISINNLLNNNENNNIKTKIINKIYNEFLLNTIKLFIKILDIRTLPQILENFINYHKKTKYFNDKIQNKVKKCIEQFDTKIFVTNRTYTELQRNCPELINNNSENTLNISLYNYLYNDIDYKSKCILQGKYQNFIQRAISRLILNANDKTKEMEIRKRRKNYLKANKPHYILTHNRVELKHKIQRDNFNNKLSHNIIFNNNINNIFNQINNNNNNNNISNNDNDNNNNIIITDHIVLHYINNFYNNFL